MAEVDECEIGGKQQEDHFGFFFSPLCSGNKEAVSQNQSLHKQPWRQDHKDKERRKQHTTSTIHGMFDTIVLLFCFFSFPHNYT